MFDHPKWVEAATELEAIIVVFDQCMCPAEADERPTGEKATALLASAAAASDVQAEFGGMRCTHEKGYHVVLRGTDADGKYRTTGSQAYLRSM